MPEVKDATGVPLTVGLKVGWGVGGRRAFGLALGVVTRIEEVTYERRQWNPETRSYDTGPSTRIEVEVKSIERGRKGWTRHAYNGEVDVVCIANQEFQGNRA